jgi:phosphoribosylglycinamide formyltransferase-1
MRMLGPEVVSAFEGRIVNVHPALLPSFPGAHAVSDALAWGAKVTGVTVHLVDEQMDHGPIVAQEAVPVLPDDDWDSLESRIHEVEHRLLPAAVRAMVEGRLRVEGRSVHVLEEPAGG